MAGYISEAWTSLADRKYCVKCIFSPPEKALSKHLCDYFSKTGVRRGCHAGAGCTKRVLRGESNEDKSTV